MKLLLLLVAAACISCSWGEDCPKNCTCSDGVQSVARCSQLNLQMVFPERVTHIIVESIPSLQINLTEGFFSKIGLNQLTSIKISNCSITYIDVDAFKDLENLKDVNLSDNGVILIHPNTFTANNNLERLVLSGNPLQPTQFLKAEENYFLKSLSLLELDLSRCQLSNIDKKLLAQLPKLQYISLKANGIKVINDYIFENTPFLDEIDISENMLMSLNDGLFEDVEELTTLNLKHNFIENIDDLDMPDLKELDVSYNSLKLLRKNTFEGMPDISTLNISHNEISWISEETFNDLIELRNLDLSYNSLIGPLPKSIFEENEYLETLILNGNKEMCKFEGFSTELPRLYHLDISECGLSNITNSSFNTMPNLAILNISKNLLKTLNHVVMSKLHRLNSLDASQNEITKVGAYTFTSNSHLRKLYLSHNKIHSFLPITFETTPYLTLLDVSYNQISHIWHANDSEYMKESNILNHLEYLNIAGNKIHELHKHNFNHLTNLKAINIQDNPLECTSEFPAFIEWLYTHRVHPLTHDKKSDRLEQTLENSNLQWDDLLINVCKPQANDVIGNKTKQKIGKGDELNYFQYTFIEDVKFTGSEKGSDTVDISTKEREKIAEEIDTYIWPTFLIVFSVVFLTLAIGNTVALLIYRSRDRYSSDSLRSTFAAPFKRSVVKIDTTPRYHKLYEECSVPNNPAAKSNLLENLVSSQIKCSILSKSKTEEV